MLRLISRRVIGFRAEGLTWTASRSVSKDVQTEPPKPPSDLPAEYFEWDYLLQNAVSDEEKKEIQSLRSQYNEVENLMKQEFKTTVDWKEFEGKVPDKILEVYKKFYADAVKDFNEGKFDGKFDEQAWEEGTQVFLQEVRGIEVEAKQKLSELDEEIKKTEGKLARLETATIDEEMAKDPELAKKIDEEVSKELGYTP